MEGTISSSDSEMMPTNAPLQDVHFPSKKAKAKRNTLLWQLGALSRARSLRRRQRHQSSVATESTMKSPVNALFAENHHIDNRHLTPRLDWNYEPNQGHHRTEVLPTQAPPTHPHLLNWSTSIGTKNNGDGDLADVLPGVEAGSKKYLKVIPPHHRIKPEKVHYIRDGIQSSSSTKESFVAATTAKPGLNDSKNRSHVLSPLTHNHNIDSLGKLGNNGDDDSIDARWKTESRDELGREFLAPRPQSPFHLRSCQLRPDQSKKTDHNHGDPDISLLPKNRCGLAFYRTEKQRPSQGGHPQLHYPTDISDRKGYRSVSKKTEKLCAGSSQCSSSAYLNTADNSELSISTQDSSKEDALLQASPKVYERASGGLSEYGESDGLSSDLNGELGIEAAVTPFRHGRDRQKRAILSSSCEVSESRSLSQKYRPRSFCELVGQAIVGQALSNAILKGKIAPVYLFHGPHGTGKTSAARIFASALNCLQGSVEERKVGERRLGERRVGERRVEERRAEERRPCGVCAECKAFASGKGSNITEVDAASHNGIEKAEALVAQFTISSSQPFSHYKVFIIDECHALTPETWNALLRILEEPPKNVLFILTTTDPDHLPRTAVSRCQRFLFSRIKDSDIVSRLRQIAISEKLTIESDCLALIASRSNGSLRDAEIALDQLSLLSHEISLSMVYDLFGSPTCEKLLDLLELAFTEDTVSIVRRARELVSSGIEPLALMTQLATLITDILAGTQKNGFNKQREVLFFKQDLTDVEIERLRKALKVLSESEKQVRATVTDPMTWLTAALLQFAPKAPPCFPRPPLPSSLDTTSHSPSAFNSASGDRDDDDSYSRTEPTTSLYDNEDQKPASRKRNPSSFSSSPSPSSSSSSPNKDTLGSSSNARIVTMLSEMAGRTEVGAREVDNYIPMKCINNEELDCMWGEFLQRCRSIPSLQRFLHSHGKLMSASISKVDATVYLEFFTPKHRCKGERYLKRIAKLFEEVIGLPTEVKIGIASACHSKRMQQLQGGFESTLQSNKLGTPFSDSHLGTDYSTTRMDIPCRLDMLRGSENVSTLEGQAYNNGHLEIPENSRFSQVLCSNNQRREFGNLRSSQMQENPRIVNGSCGNRSPSAVGKAIVSYRDEIQWKSSNAASFNFLNNKSSTSGIQNQNSLEGAGEEDLA